MPKKKDLKVAIHAIRRIAESGLTKVKEESREKRMERHLKSIINECQEVLPEIIDMTGD